MDLHEIARHIPCTSWPNKFLERLGYFDVEALLAEECGIYGMTIKPCTVKHPSVRISCFARKTFGKVRAVGYYYGTTLDRNMNDGPPEKSLGNETMASSPQEFQTWAFHLRQRDK